MNVGYDMMMETSFQTKRSYIVRIDALSQLSQCEKATHMYLHQERENKAGSAHNLHRPQKTKRTNH